MYVQAAAHELAASAARFLRREGFCIAIDDARARLLVYLQNRPVRRHEIVALLDGAVMEAAVRATRPAYVRSRRVWRHRAIDPQDGAALETGARAPHPGVLIDLVGDICCCAAAATL